MIINKAHFLNPNPCIYPRKKMRLFTHNFLQCHVRSCTKDNFPLKFEQDAEVQIKTAEYNADFLALQMCKIDYSALLDGLKEVQSVFYFRKVY